MNTDYIQKRYLYEGTEAQEYWIVDRCERQVRADAQKTGKPADTLSLTWCSWKSLPFS